jgi:hypothetical protein
MFFLLSLGGKKDSAVIHCGASTYTVCKVLTVPLAAEITLALIVKAKVIKKVFRCECAFHIIHEPFGKLNNKYSVHSFGCDVKKKFSPPPHASCDSPNCYNKRYSSFSS